MPEASPQMQVRDGRAWHVGSDKQIAWINEGVTPGLSITASIPPMFAAYATLVFPLGLESSREDTRPAEDRFDDALLRVLCGHTDPQSWWLGFLDTGASDVVFVDAPRVRMYSGWNYVLVHAGPREARTWRSDEDRWFTALPEVMFPADRSWLVSSLWDDAWAGIGGSERNKRIRPSQTCGRRACPTSCTSGCGASRRAPSWF